MFEDLKKTKQHREERELSDFLDGIVLEMKKKSWSTAIVRAASSVFNQKLADVLNESEKGKRINELSAEILKAPFCSLFEEETTRVVEGILKNSDTAR